MPTNRTFFFASRAGPVRQTTTAVVARGAVLPGVLARLAHLDRRSLATLRIALGLILLADLVERSTRLVRDTTDAGLLPRGALEASELPWAFVHGLGGSFAFSIGCMALGAAIATALLLGFRSRLAALAALVFWASLQARNPMIGHHGDTALRLLLLWGALLPLGDRWSLDARRAASRPGAVPPANACDDPASLGYLLQLAFIYVFSVAYKIGPAWLERFDAVELALRVQGYARPMGEALLMAPLLLRLATVAVLLLEAVGPLLLFWPRRRDGSRALAAALFIGFHVFLGATMRLGSFVPIMIAAWIAVLPGSLWDTLERRLPALGRPRSANSGEAGHVWSPPRWMPAAVATALALATNVDSLATFRASHGDAVLPTMPTAGRLSRRLGLHQEWAMFAPEPAAFAGGLRALTVRDDGTWVDLTTGDSGSLVEALPRLPGPLRLRQEALRWQSGHFLGAAARFAAMACSSPHAGSPVAEVVLVAILRPTRPVAEEEDEPPLMQTLSRVSCRPSPPPTAGGDCVIDHDGAGARLARDEGCVP